MATWICDDCLQEIESVTKPWGCPACGRGPWIRRLDDEPERDRDEDDGLTYADPRDERDERRFS